jgi:hypothetical protein
VPATVALPANEYSAASALPTKQFTDEELKQHYGIHLAARLPAEEAGKESKWADIDDDEDDWAAPEIKWLDGTTSTINLSQANPDQLMALEEEKAQEVQQIIQVPQQVPQQIPMMQRTTLSANRAILKPGGHMSSQSKGLVGMGGKGGNDKSSLSSMQTPAKSPWASLPPVDKASPVQFVPPAPPPPRFGKDPNGFEGLTGPAAEPKEIEADDFNRVWNQENPRAKELYIPQSNRFESVNDHRRASNRGDGHKPAVLQRPSYGGPAEPSAAFQTHRSGGVESPSWPRHRTGSMSSSGRRMSFGQSSDRQSDRPELSASSPHLGMVQPHGSRQLAPMSPSLTFAEPVIEDQADSIPETAEVPTPSETTEDPVSVQQRLMREKIERARAAKQRQIEEEAREEKAKQERLKAKIQALAGAGPSPSAEVKESRLKHSASPKTRAAHGHSMAVVSPPKPPVPTSEGEVAQYGMMKVHQPHPVRRQPISEGSLMSRQSGDGDKRSGSDANHQKFTPNGRVPTAAEKSQMSADKRDDSALWRVTELPETLSGWSISSGSNVWAPPQSKDRALGNGTFDSSAYARPGPGVLGSGRPINHVPGAPPANGAVPGPIARPTSSNVPATSAPRTSNPISSAVDEKSQAYLDSASFARLQQPAEMGQRIPIQAGAPTRYGALNPALESPLNLSTWANPAEAIRAQDAALEKRNAELLEEARRNPQSRVIHETYYDRKAGERLGESVIVSVTKNIYVEDVQKPIVNGPPKQPPFRPATNFGPQINHDGTHPKEKTAVAQSLASAASQAANAAAARSSRFFPRSDTAESSDNADSPPPPDASSLDGPRGMASPVVNLPRPVVVKLPPARPAENRSIQASSVHNRTSTAPTSDWQNKINKLLGHGKSADTTDLLNAASRAPLDVTVSQLGATVSLPSATYRSFAFASDKSSSKITRELDHALFPQPEFGSTPTIRFPQTPFINAALPSNPIRTFSSIWRSKERDMSTAKPTFDAVDAIEGPKFGDIQIAIRLYNMVEAKFVPYHLEPTRNASRGAQRQFKPRRGNGEGPPTNTGPRRSSNLFTPRETSTPSRGAHTVRGRPTRAAFTSRRNITAPTAGTVD